MLFGGYRGGYNVMPQGWMDAATQVGQNYAKGIQGLVGGIAGGYTQRQSELGQQGATQQSLPTNMSQYEQVAQATGQPVDPTIIERFSNRNDLSGAGLMQLNKDIAGAQQNAIALANMQRQQQQYNMQMEAARRGMAVQQLGRGVDQFLDNPMIPAPVQQQQVSSPAAPAYSTAPPPSNFIFRGNDASSMVPNVGTLSGMRVR
jgi:hypothetical protein